jgi:1-deoxy-D-xylulose-5-phosphate reductoisomerase
MKKIVILGATGSIGASCFDLVRKNRDKFEIVGISGHSRFEDLTKIAQELNIKYLLDTRNNSCHKNENYNLANNHECSNIPLTNNFKSVSNNLNEIYENLKFREFLDLCEADIVLNGIVGFAGLKFSIDILNAKIPLALANKESLVAGGEILMALSKKQKTPIIPVDSEHSAIFEVLIKTENYDYKTLEYKKFNKILLTCSGGSFYGKNSRDLANVTVDQALKHPNWSMGAKITIDSATLANKSLEFFEAMHLFKATKDQIEIIIHRESIVHSMVEFKDSSILAQLAPPNMELPIGVALNFPEKSDYQLPRQNFKNLSLNFNKPDTETFRTLQVLEFCAERMANFPIVFNAVNEVAVEAFLQNKIKFLDIFTILEQIIYTTKSENPDSVEKILEIDKKSRDLARDVLETL